MGVYCESLPQEVTAGVYHESLPWEVTAGGFCESLPWEFTIGVNCGSLGVYHGSLPQVTVEFTVGLCGGLCRGSTQVYIGVYHCLSLVTIG